jgi:polysaccharide export outer membrane protein
MKWMQNLVRGLMSLVMLMAAVAAQAAPSGDYVLGIGDVIRVSVYQNPDLSLDARVSEAGTISFPLLGTVKIGGLAVSDAEKKIANGLRDGNFLKQPQVSIFVQIVKGNQVSVLGLVNRPGRYPLEQTNTKLSEIIAAAGGVSVGSGSDIVVVTGLRNGKSFRTEIDFPRIFAAVNAADDMILQNGDTVYVDRAPVIYVYGEVYNPGIRGLQPDMTLMQGLAASGGINQRGTEKGIRIHRRDPVTGQIQVLSLGMNDKLQRDDVVYVKESLF